MLFKNNIKDISIKELLIYMLFSRGVTHLIVVALTSCKQKVRVW